MYPRCCHQFSRGNMAKKVIQFKTVEELEFMLDIIGVDYYPFRIGNNFYRIAKPYNPCDLNPVIAHRDNTTGMWEYYYFEK